MLSKSEAKRHAVLDGVEVRHFEDGSRGLYAAKQFRQGETIKKLPEQTIPERDMYSIEVYPGVHVDCSWSLVGALNHGCYANCRVRNGKIVAWECIPAGTELTINYRLTETHLSNPFTCKCCGEEMKW